MSTLTRTRRDFLSALAAFGTLSARSLSATSSANLQRNFNVLYGQDTLGVSIRSRIIDNNNGVKMHILESGFEGQRPCVILLHGFPELAYTWRN